MNVVLSLMRIDQWPAQKIPFWTWYVCFVVYSDSAKYLPHAHHKVTNNLFGAWKKSGINLGVNYQDSGVVRGVTRGAQFPGAEMFQ